MRGEGDRFAAFFPWTDLDVKSCGDRLILQLQQKGVELRRVPTGSKLLTHVPIRFGSEANVESQVGKRYDQGEFFKIYVTQHIIGTGKKRRSLWRGYS